MTKKIKTFAIEVEVRSTHILYVDARTEKTACERLLTEDGWREATAYYDEVDSMGYRNAEVVNVRQAW